MNNLYPCYSTKLMKFLSSKGIRYELCGRHPSKEMTMWVYIRNEELNKALEDYESSK